MSDDPQADLIYAILAMDSYNRGYGSSISGLNVSAKSNYGDTLLNPQTLPHPPSSFDPPRVAACLDGDTQ